jgi:hypothetical protein
MELGSIQRWRMYWKNAAWPPLPHISGPAARQLQCTLRRDQSSRPVLRVNGGKGQCHISGGGSNQFAWTLSMQQGSDANDGHLDAPAPVDA